jgi:hypothetical protein
VIVFLIENVLQFLFLHFNKKQKIIELIVNKFKNKPNSEYLFLWLQRIAIVANIRIDHKESEEKLFKFRNY